MLCRHNIKRYSPDANTCNLLTGDMCAVNWLSLKKLLARSHCMRQDKGEKEVKWAGGDGRAEGHCCVIKLWYLTFSQLFCVRMTDIIARKKYTLDKEEKLEPFNPLFSQFAFEHIDQNSIQGGGIEGFQVRIVLQVLWMQEMDTKKMIWKFILLRFK